MPVDAELTSEISAAVEQAVAEPSKVEEAKSETPTVETPSSPETPGVPAQETVVEHEDKTPETPEEHETTETPATPVVPAEPQKQTIGDAALTQAVQYGIPIEEARLFPSDTVLRRAISAIQQSIAAQVRQDAPVVPVAEEDPFASLPKLDPSVYEPEVIKSFEALTGIVRKQQEAIKAFQSQSEQIARGNQEVASREVTQWFDKQVESLGKDFQDALGTGGYNALDRGSSQFAKREAIANQVAVLLGGYRAAGQQSPPREQVFDSAARLVLRDEYQKAHDSKLAGDLAKRSTQHIQRAGGQHSKKTTDPLADTAALLDEKFFSKK